MEQVNLIIDTYQRIILESESKLAKVKQHIYRIGTLRLILFAAGSSAFFNSQQAKK